MEHLANPKSGFHSSTNTFHSLRNPSNIPPADAPLSAADFAHSFRAKSPWPLDTVALIDSASGYRLTYAEFFRRADSLASYLKNTVKLSKGDTAFVLTSNSVRVPILFHCLISLGVVISPANPVSTESEISRQVKLVEPVIAFATSSSAHKLPRADAFRFETILIDSIEFEWMMTNPVSEIGSGQVKVSQSDLLAIMYSSGTTGKVKGVMLTHRNLTALLAEYGANHAMNYAERDSPVVLLPTVPFFHIYGFYLAIRSVAMSETLVVMERFDVRNMLGSIDEFKVTHVAAAPPVVVVMAKINEITDDYDLRSLETVSSGGAPLGKDVIAAFTVKFPPVVLHQGYGLTETTATVSRTVTPEESYRWGSVGKLAGGCEAKIVDPDTGAALPPCKQGELWVRGPTVMKGYIGDPEATSATIVSDGWLKTGDVCYFDEEGYLFVVDRLKELIKYKGYQVPPAELEQLLHSHPEIADAAVIPYPDEEAGEVPMACVVRQPQSRINEAEVMDFVAKQVAPYKKIRRVVFTKSIPKSASGKILRIELKKNLISGFPSKL